jgi:acyl-ACP thioesterase
MMLAELVAPVPGGRMYESAFRAGLGDATPSGRVRLDTIARWLQDVAFDDVDDAGLWGRAAWVVRRARIKVERFPRFREPVTAQTFCSGFGRMWAERRTTITGPEGRVEAAALWVHLDPVSGRPIPFDEDEIAMWTTSANGRAVKARLRHESPPEGTPGTPWHFRATDMDLAEHINNAVYWEPLEEDLLTGGGDEPATLDAEIEFRDAAQPGDALVLRDAGRLWITAQDGRIHASIVVAAT